MTNQHLCADGRQEYYNSDAADVSDFQTSYREYVESRIIRPVDESVPVCGDGPYGDGTIDVPTD